MDRILSIPLAQIDIPDDRLRQMDSDWADGLAQSLSVSGLQNPITVTIADKKGRHVLIAGLHRLTAATRLEWPEINAIIFTGSKLEQRLVEIDENLIRRELSPLDRASHLAERQRIYEELYPETKKGVAHAVARWGDVNEKFSFTSFTADVAEKLGLSQRMIQLSISRYTKIAPDVRAQIASTWIADKGVELDALAKLEPALQRKAVANMLNGEAKSVKAAAALLQGVRPVVSSNDDDEFDRLLTAWRRGGARARKRFVDWLIEEGEVIRPAKAA
ncbi:ParB/RepB/Spo0J family partition protein [Pararhodobacter sp.]|uniref:ParB/RepB/Spo0J family partition protein n=1 Tax=Pararhodobacter sp. TaxID=2127056 RepID=UPI002AFE52D8|nr:ParB N-terminal domain-containing protein [Pararhodobacter sp.]